MQTQFTERDIARFWRSVDKTTSPHGCWLWTGSKNQLGYGRFFAQGKLHSAHRVAWVLIRGPIPEGALACHDCPGGDNPSCVNAEAHLFLGTDRENAVDMVQKGRNFVARGDAHPKAKLTPETVQLIRTQWDARTTPKNDIARALAQELGVSVSLVWQVGNRKVWRHI